MNKRMKDRIVDAATRLSLFLGATGFHSALNAQEAPLLEQDSLNSEKTEMVRSPIEQKQDSASFELSASKADSLNEEIYSSISKSETKKKLYLDTYRATTQNDSILNLRREKLKACEEYMVYLIAHFEGFKSRAYWDPNGKCWTYGVGNCEKANGTKVVRGDAIRTEEEGVAVVTHHIDKNMADDMVKYLPMEHMSEVEVAVMGSLLYNTGSGKLRNKDRTPSELSDIATIHFVLRTEGSEREFKEKYLSYKRAKSGANILLDRRENEYAILSGEVDLPISRLKGTMLGALHGCHGDADKIEERFAPDSKLACPTDSLHYAMKQDLARTYVRKSTPTKSKTPTRGRMQPRPRSRTR